MDSPWTLKTLCDAYEALQRARTPEELRVEMAKFARQMGFEHFIYALSINAPSLKPQQYALNGFPHEWLERYVARGYFKLDPVVRHALTTSLPAIWTEDRFRDSEAAAGFWDEAKTYGLNCGLSFVVHEQPGVTGIFSL